jgi:hypothetical protein
MKRQSAAVLLVIAVIVDTASICWLFNVCAYNFWLGGQQIANKAVYVHRFYSFLGLLALAVAIEAYLVWRLVKRVSQ